MNGNMNREQLEAVYALAEATRDEDRRRKVGRRLDALDGFVCDYTFAHTRHWCHRKGCRGS